MSFGFYFQCSEMMNRILLSPHYSPKRLQSRYYLEHKHTKKIILINSSLYEIFSDPYHQLFGIDNTSSKLKKSCNENSLHMLFQEHAFLKEGSSYNEVSIFFVRPKGTLLGLPLIEKEKSLNSIVLFGVPINIGNPNKNNLDQSLNIARNYCSKYNLNISHLKNASSIKNENYAFVLSNKIYEMGDIYINKRQNITDTFIRVQQISKELIQNNNLYIAIGGDHSISYPLFKGAKNVHKDLIFIHIDAHNDLFMLSECNFEDLYLSHSSLIGKLLIEENKVYSFGLRGFVNSDSIAIGKNENYNYNFSNSSNEFIEQIKNELKYSLKKSQKVYLSIDIDVLDPRYFESVTDPIPNGINYDALIEGIKLIISSTNIIAIDVVEANLNHNSPIDTHNYLQFIISLLNLTCQYHGNKQDN
ncbi:MAG: hypothetical protein CL843_16105 [Crocinitomicaceae bacterium]|nr:hypothetical protein [Crocinitomicaceae bacterium]|tara:strand:+ start:5987 stop:7234 length:1248 start_codon:yes stop_codon:yes gene_type:complete